MEKYRKLETDTADIQQKLPTVAVFFSFIEVNRMLNTTVSVCCCNITMVMYSEFGTPGLHTEQL